MNISLTTNEDTAATINVTESVKAATALEVSMGSPSNGVIAVVSANTAWTYTPKADWFGTDIFQYNVTADGVTVTALGNITVVTVPGENVKADTDLCVCSRSFRSSELQLAQITVGSLPDHDEEAAYVIFTRRLFSLLFSSFGRQCRSQQHVGCGTVHSTNVVGYTGLADAITTETAPAIVAPV
jgi:hypothetical protein